MTIKEFRDKLKTFRAFVTREAGKIVMDEQEYIKDLNRERLYNEGKGADDVTLGRYRPFTVRVKRMNRPGHDSRTENITLKDTGSFYEAMELKEVKPTEFRLKSTSETAEILAHRPQFKEALGLTKEESNVMSEIVAQKLAPEIINYFQ